MRPAATMDTSPGFEPVADRASPSRWRGWATRLLETGLGWLGAVGVVLALGLAAGIGALTLFVKLTSEVLERETATLDESILRAVRGLASPGLDAVMTACAWLGAEGVAALVAVLGLVLVRRRRWGAAGALILVAGGAQVLDSFAKLLVQRPRPTVVDTVLPGQSYSFPSGHAMVAAAFYLFLAYLAWRGLRGWARALAVAGALAVVGLVGLSRVYLGAHYPSDVVAGYLVGFVWADTVAIGAWLLARRRSPDAAAGGPCARLGHDGHRQHLS